MLQEALEFLFDRAAEQAAKRQARKVDFLPTDGRSVWVERDDKLEQLVIGPPLRRHAVEQIESLIAAGEKWSDENVVWIDPSQVVMILDDDDRREYVTLALRPTPLFELLVALQAQPALDQHDFVRLLRREFRDQPGVERLLTTVRKIKFRSLTQGHSIVQQGNESLGRQVENEVSGIDSAEWPDWFGVSTRVYTNAGEELTASIPIDLEVVPTKQKFVVSPMPGVLDDAVDAALAGIKGRIEAGLPDVPVLFGRP